MSTSQYMHEVHRAITCVYSFISICTIPKLNFKLIICLQSTHEQLYVAILKGLITIQDINLQECGLNSYLRNSIPTVFPRNVYSGGGGNHISAYQQPHPKDVFVFPPRSS